MSLLQVHSPGSLRFFIICCCCCYILYFFYFFPQTRVKFRNSSSNKNIKKSSEKKERPIKKFKIKYTAVHTYINMSYDREMEAIIVEDHLQSVLNL